jgi:acetyl-CoA carboxylase carboxyl transferase subunit alpha
VPEPNGGAQNNWDESAVSLGKSLKASLDRLAGLTPKELVDHRYEKFRKIGSFFEG